MKMQNPGFGVFSKLPYELREQIWLHFLPVGEERGSSTKTSAKVDLRVLLASRNLYEEISSVLYSKTCLHFDISPDSDYELPLWSIVYFKRRSQGRTDHTNDDKQAVWWKLDNKPSCRDHRFDNFPYHKISAVEVSLSPPEYDYPEELVWIWRNVVRTCDIFREASSIPSLVIQLREGEINDWYDKKGKFRNVNPASEPRDILDYELLTLPFYNLRHLTSIKVEPHSKELERKMDWKLIDWANRVVSKRNGDCETDVDDFGERKLWVNVVNDYVWAHEQLFYPDNKDRESANLTLVRREWVCQESLSFMDYKLKIIERWAAFWTQKLDSFA